MRMCNSLSKKKKKNTFQVRGDFFQFKTNHIPLIQTVVSLTPLYTISLTPKMLRGEIGEQARLQCLQCALLLNSHYKNTVALRCKQGVYVSFAPENWLIWCWKCGMIGKSARQKASHAGSRMRTSLLLRDHPLHSFCQKISRHPPSLVTASAQALSGLPDAGATMSPCQGQDLPRCVWCAPSFLLGDN